MYWVNLHPYCGFESRVASVLNSIWILKPCSVLFVVVREKPANNMIRFKLVSTKSFCFRIHVHGIWLKVWSGLVGLWMLGTLSGKILGYDKQGGESCSAWILKLTRTFRLVIVKQLCVFLTQCVVGGGRHSSFVTLRSKFPNRVVDSLETSSSFISSLVPRPS